MNDWDKKPLLRTSEEGQSPIRISILGDFVLSNAGGRQFPIATKKNRALLAILALSPGFQATRERLCGLLWGDRGEDQARSSLRQSLAVLRKELGGVEDLVLKTHDDIVALRRDTAQVDAIDFLALSNDSEIIALRKAVKLYRGELLSDTSIRDAAFEDWLSAERARLRTVAIKIFDRLTPLEEGHSRIATAQQLISFDPLRESSHRLLMQAYADQGDNGLALKQFELCRKLLHEELSVEPAAETQALRTTIAKGTFSKAEAAAGVSKGEGFDRSPPVSTDKPSIAVLPFANLTGDPHQDFLCDGISQNITDDLARFHDLIVIASDSAFVYRNRNTSIQAMSQDLGARYLLQGSVVTSGNHLRIQARLVDGKSGQQVWSESYDGHPDSIFSLQDSVTKTITSTLATAYGGRLLKAWERRPDRAATRSMQAIDLFQRGMQSLNRFTKDDNKVARRLFQEAAQTDPHYAKPIAKSAWSHMVDCLFGWTDNPQTSLQASLELARKAVSTDPDEPWAYWALSGYYQHEGDFERALAGYEKALELNPNDADVVTDYGWCLSFAGRAEEGLAMAQKAMMLNPHHPDWYIFQFAQLQFNAKKYRDAVNTTKRLREVETASAQLYLAASYAALGESKNANMAVTRALELDPQASIERYTSRDMVQYQVVADLDRLRDFLRNAGLPERSNSVLARMDENPSIAVLHFTNLSGDQQQDYFASGVSDDLVLALSRFQEIRVLQADASNGSSTLQKLSDGNSLTKLADFILSGSIRKNGDRIRITVQLRSTRSSQVCWTDQYDRHTHDIFAVQDEIVEACAYSIVNQINTKTLQALQLGRTENHSAYELFIQARFNAYKQNEESTRLAAQLLQNAVQLDPHFAAAHAWLAETIWVAWWAGWRDDKNTALSAALNHARLAVEFDNSDPHGFAELGQAYLYQGEFSLAQGAIERSLFLNPNNPDAMIIYSFYWLYTGDAEKAYGTIQSAIRRDPNGHYGLVLGIILYFLGRWEESAAALRHVRAKFHSVDAWLATALAMNGDQIAAQVAASQYLANRSPSMLVGEATAFILERNPFKAQKDIELVRDGLTKAGL